MRNFDPSSIFVFFAILVFSGIIDFPFLIVMFIVYTIFNSANKSKKQKTKGNRRDYRRQTRSTTSNRRRTEADYRRQRNPANRRPAQPAPKPRPKKNPFKTSGLAKYRDYEYDAAIEDFKKALQINSADIAVHFNLACAYSLTEQTEKAFDHLSKAVQHGFTDFEKIKTHDALAFVRIQDEFEPFVKNGYKWPLQSQEQASPQVNIKENNDILEQLNRLGELRERGLLTEEEFTMQKKRLLG